MYLQDKSENRFENNTEYKGNLYSIYKGKLLKHESNKKSNYFLEKNRMEFP